MTQTAQFLDEFVVTTNSSASQSFQRGRTVDSDDGEFCSDQARRELLGLLGVVKRTSKSASPRMRGIHTKIVSASYERSTDALIDFVAELGLTTELEQARKDLAEVIESNSGLTTLRELRLKAGLSQKGLAQMIGGHQPRIAAFESGAGNLGLATAKRLAGALNVTIDAIVKAYEAGGGKDSSDVDR